MLAGPALSAPRKPTFPWLTALRGALAIWIILNHIGSPAFGPAPWIEEWLHLVKLRPFDIPTTAFFILSGIIFGSGRQPTPDWGGAVGFWRARFARIYPIYILALLACSPRGWIKSDGDITMFALSGITEALFLQGYGLEGSWYVKWNPISWFMSCIALCYLVFPWISRWLLSAKSPVTLVIFGLGAALVTDFLGIMTSLGALPGSHDDIRYFPPYSLPAFILGSCAGALLARGEKPAVLWLVAMASAFSLLSLAFLFKSYAFCFMVVAGPIALFITGVCFVPSMPPAFLMRLGDVAFTLYMSHWTLHLWMKHGLLAIGLVGFYESLPGLLAFFAILTWLALWLNKNFERPMQRYLSPKRVPGTA